MDDCYIPWAYTRSRLAATWGVPPWEVDAAPLEEIVTQLDLWEIQSKSSRSKERRRKLQADNG